MLRCLCADAKEVSASKRDDTVYLSAQWMSATGNFAPRYSAFPPVAQAIPDERSSGADQKSLSTILPRQVNGTSTHRTVNTQGRNNTFLLVTTVHLQAPREWGRCVDTHTLFSIRFSNRVSCFMPRLRCLIDTERARTIVTSLHDLWDFASLRLTYCLLSNSHVRRSFW